MYKDAGMSINTTVHFIEPNALTHLRHSFLVLEVTPFRSYLEFHTKIVYKCHAVTA